MYEKYQKLLKARGIRSSEVARATGIPASTFTDWKNGRSAPKIEKLKKIADFFDISVSYFTGEEDGPQYYQDEETARLAQEMFENSELRALFDVAADMDPEDLKAMYTMALALKRKERGED